MNIIFSVVALEMSLIMREANLLIGIERDVEWIEKELKLMQSSLEHVEAKRQPGEDEAKWADEAREIIEEVGNAIDIFVSKTLYYRRRTWKGPVSVLKHLMDRFKLRMKKEKIKVKIRDFSKQRPKQKEGGPYSLQCKPSSSQEPQISDEAINAVASIILKVNAILSQNLLAHKEEVKIVEHIVDEYKHLYGILTNFNSDTDLDKRTIAWFEEIKDTLIFTEQIFAEENLKKTTIIVKVAFPFYKDLRFSKNLLRVRFKILDLYKRMWTFGIGDLKECPNSTISVITRLPSRIVETTPSTVDHIILGLMGLIFYPIGGLIKGILRTLMDMDFERHFDQLGSIKGNLRIMNSLFEDVDDTAFPDQRVNDWLDEMRSIARDPVIKDLEEYVSQSEKDRTTTPLWKVLRKWKNDQRIIRKIKLISRKFHDISERKWTYDIGKIERTTSADIEDDQSPQLYRLSTQDINDDQSQQLQRPSTSDEARHQDITNPQQAQVESIRRELKLMCALYKDVKSMDGQNARIRVWAEQMQDVAGETKKFIDSYVDNIEQKGVGVLRRIRFNEFMVPKEISRIKTHIHEISQTKWTYDIGGIHRRKGTAHGLSIPEPEASSEQAHPIYSRQADRIFVFLKSILSLYAAIGKVLLQRQISDPDKQLEKNVESIRKQRSLMRALLEDVGELERCDGQLKAWVEEIKHVANEVDAAMVAYNEVIEHKWQGLLKRFQVATRFERIMQNIQDISYRKMVYGIDLNKRRETVSTMDRDAHTTLPLSFFIKPQNILSFYDDVQAVLGQLLTDNERCSIISIVGMEGIGKTTLADLIYKSSTATGHFPCYAWVSIPPNCNVEALLTDIEEQVRRSLREYKRKHKGLQEQKAEHFAKEEPMQTLNCSLTVNRYLIVLDDVRKAEIWDALEKEFPRKSNGSRIVLTTRDVDVATHANPNSIPHKLHLLSDDDSWALFTRTLTIPHGLLERSKKMVITCGGLPRAILQLREQFSSIESTFGAWSRVIENPNLDQKPWQKMMDVMKDSLPLYLKHALFYLGRFPAYFEIPLRRLIILWIAEGIVHQRRGDEDLPESVAERYVAELIDRNMVQVTKKNLNGSFKKCRLPYALRELWSSESKKVESANSHPKKGPSPRKIRHLAHHSDQKDVSFDHVHGSITNLPANLSPDYKYVISFRSFDTREGSQPGKVLGKFLDQCISRRYFLILRVLDLERVFRPELPKALGELVLLSYLGLRWTYLESLPSFVSKLLSLQTLDLKHTSISSLPTSIWKMAQLRHLYLDESYRCRFVPRPSGHCLTDLQTLWSVFIDEDSPVKDGLDRLIKLTRLGVTSRLMSTRSQAMLSQLEVVAKWVEKLKQLQSLRLKSFDKSGKPWDLPKMCLEGHTNLSSIYLLGKIVENDFLVSGLPLALTELTLSGSGLSEDPMPTLGYQPNLRVLRLFSESFSGKQMLCSSGSFPQLRILKLWKLEQLEEWKVENGAFPNNFDLEIRSCKNLKMLPDELRKSRTLQILNVSDMPEEWDNIGENAPCASNDINNVGKYNVPKASVNLTSQIREIMLKPAINKSQKIFLRKIATEELPIGSKKCHFCGGEPESAVHLFFLCKPVKMIWFSKWGIRTDDFSNLSISEWINHILTPSLIFGDSHLNETDFLRFAVILMEKTWLWRERVISDHVEVHPDLIYQETCSSFTNNLVIRE